MNIKIHYPTAHLFSETNTSMVWYEYLLYGFMQEYQVEMSKKLSHQSYNIVKSNDPKHLTKFIVEIDGKQYPCWYCFSDFHHYHSSIRQEGDFYFKTHFTKDLYNEPRVYPIGQTVGNLQYIENLSKLRGIRKFNDYMYDVVAIYRTTSYNIRLNAVTQLKNSKFRTLTGLKDFNPGKTRPFAPKEFKKSKLLPYLDHMKLQAQSKFILAFPGVDQSRSWRHSEAWGLGAPLIALDLKSINPGNYDDCYIKVEDDLSDLLPKLEHYSRYRHERERIAKNGLEYWEKYLSPSAMAKNIVNTIIKEGKHESF